MVVNYTTRRMGALQPGLPGPTAVPLHFPLMANSPTPCLEFAVAIIWPVHQVYPSAYIIHYIDSILLAHESLAILHQVFTKLNDTLCDSCLMVAPEKVQTTAPFS